MLPWCILVGQEEVIDRATLWAYFVQQQQQKTNLGVWQNYIRQLQKIRLYICYKHISPINMESIFHKNPCRLTLKTFHIFMPFMVSDSLLSIDYIHGHDASQAFLVSVTTPLKKP